MQRPFSTEQSVGMPDLLFRTRAERLRAWYNLEVRDVATPCPFSIEEYHIGDEIAIPRNKTFLIRERDEYGEFPYIYAKICQTETIAQVDGEQEDTVHKVIVLSDTGCGSETRCVEELRASFQAGWEPPASREELMYPKYPDKWNIFTFLEHKINPRSQIPYLVMTTHCHFDHIMGIGKFPPTRGIQAAIMDTPSDWRRPQPPPITVLASSRGKSFVTPYSNLQKHSLAGTLGLSAPEYEVGIWADDFSQVVYNYPRPSSSSFPSTASQPDPCMIQIPTPYTILHTPGHTPDSLSWYDSDHHVLCVGDSFYLKGVRGRRTGNYDPPMPTMFNLESNLADWWRSVHKVLDFVVQKNGELEKAAKDNLAELGDRMSDGGGDVENAGEDTDGTNFVVLDIQDESRRVSDPPLPESSCIQPAATSALHRSSIFGLLNASSRESPGQGGFEPASENEAPVLDLSSQEIEGEHEHRYSWLMVDSDDDAEDPSTPLTLTCSTSSFHTLPQTQPQTRVELAAAHTTSSTDALTAILEIRAFVAAVLRDEVPKKQVEDGSRGEERWLWDYALATATDPAEENGFGWDAANGENYSRFSVLAPLVVIEEGRKSIPPWDWIIKWKWRDGQEL